jgi:XTP/dITP diphosphohydrolase
MYRKFVENKLLIASNNKGKISEFRQLFAPYNIEIISAIDLQIDEPEETGQTFSDNAVLKAEYYSKLSKLPALADDSGLSIEALGGFPGVISARIAGENKDYNQAFSTIEQLLLEKNLSSSKAFFTCALSICWPDGHYQVFEGELNGTVSFPAVAGGYGFGYAPIFMAEGHDCKLSEIPDYQKNIISHRFIAFEKLINACFK